MSDQVASHSDETQEAVQAAFSAFGLDVEEDTSEATEHTQEASTEATEDTDEAPATEQTTEPRTIKVKHNKQEIEVDVSDDKLPEYVQKALALEKERERKSELERNLDRAAKLAGYDSHAEYIANLDRLEKEAVKRQEDQFKDLRSQLRQDAEDNGLDPAKVEAWLDSHPLLQQAQRAILDRQKLELEYKMAQSTQEVQRKWDAMYESYPELIESSHVFKEGGTPDWYTPEMQDRISRGYDPKDAYELAHKNTIIERNRKMAEQKAIKDQRLGLRAQVETNGRADTDPEVPDDLAAAFSLFGFSKSDARKYVKK